MSESGYGATPAAPHDSVPSDARRPRRWLATTAVSLFAVAALCGVLASRARTELRGTELRASASSAAFVEPPGMALHHDNDAPESEADTDSGEMTFDGPAPTPAIPDIHPAPTPADAGSAPSDDGTVGASGPASDDGDNKVHCGYKCFESSGSEEDDDWGQNATFATDDTQKAADGGRLMGAHGDDDDSRR